MLNQKIKSEEKINSEEGLLSNTNQKEEENTLILPQEEIDNIKKKFIALNTSINNMEAFYHSINLIFDVWMRYIKALLKLQKIFMILKIRVMK